MAGMKWQCGLALDRKMFDKFKESLEKIAKEKHIKDIVSVIKIDSLITLKDINSELIDEIKELEPFGEKNREPLFICKNLKINSIRALGLRQAFEANAEKRQLFSKWNPDLI